MLFSSYYILASCCVLGCVLFVLQQYMEKKEKWKQKNERQTKPYNCWTVLMTVCVLTNTNSVYQNFVAILVHTMKAWRGGGIVLCFLCFGTRWRWMLQLHASTALLLREPIVHTVWQAGLVQLVWTPLLWIKPGFVVQPACELGIMLKYAMVV
jgi:hypothetical protein